MSPYSSFKLRVKQKLLFAAMLFVLTANSCFGESSPQTDFDRGMALAKTGNWKDATQALKDGERKYPADKRFPLELAGIAFKQKDYPTAKHYLLRTLQLDPTDTYANDFLGTIFYLDENLDAALKYWNRIGKPYVEQIVMTPEPPTNEVLLDRAFKISPESVFGIEDFEETKARIDLLEVFDRHRFELSPQQDGTFNLIFRAQPLVGISNNVPSSLIRSMRGIPYQTVYADVYDLNQSAVNLHFLYRWDAQKRRIFQEMAGCLAKDPDWRYNIFLDARNERWNLAENLAEIKKPELPDLKFESLAGGVGVETVLNSRLNWRTGIRTSYRENGPVPRQENIYFEDGFSLSYQSGFEYRLFRNPEHRFLSTLDADVRLGRFFTNPAGIYSTITAQYRIDWFPTAKQDANLVTAKFRGGIAAGKLPFDEIFSLGMERDNLLEMHGHAGTNEGKKGNAPLGNRYLLINLNWNKQFYRNAFLTASLGPILDTGKIIDSNGVFESQGWLVDTGIQSIIKTFTGVEIVFSYARDLRRGNGLFYVSTGLPLSVPH